MENNGNDNNKKKEWNKELVWCRVEYFKCLVMKRT